MARLLFSFCPSKKNLNERHLWHWVAALVRQQQHDIWDGRFVFKKQAGMGRWDKNSHLISCHHGLPACLPTLPASSSTSLAAWHSASCCVTPCLCLPGPSFLPHPHLCLWPCLGLPSPFPFPLCSHLSLTSLTCSSLSLISIYGQLDQVGGGGLVVSFCFGLDMLRFSFHCVLPSSPHACACLRPTSILLVCLACAVLTCSDKASNGSQ